MKTKEYLSERSHRTRLINYRILFAQGTVSISASWRRLLGSTSCASTYGGHLGKNYLLYTCLKDHLLRSSGFYLKKKITIRSRQYIT